MISTAHYISQGETPRIHLENLRRMALAGADWMQLRVKEESLKTVLKTAKAAKMISDRYRVKLIINDFPEIAKLVNADGVHLGRADLCPLEARRILGEEKIIGGTANTLEDCEHLVKKQVDYIGLGPFRFTATKKNLSPVLGITGYKKVLEGLYAIGADVPVIAIGGITAVDLPELKKTGVHGIAISAELTAHKQPRMFLQEIYNQFSERQS